MAMMNLGKMKKNHKNKRNHNLKPPKRNNQNSSTDSSFSSLGNICIKPNIQEQFTPKNYLKGTNNLIKKAESPSDMLQKHNLNFTLDTCEGNLTQLSTKGMEEINL
jgi:hypothetical protein